MQTWLAGAAGGRRLAVDYRKHCQEVVEAFRCIIVDGFVGDLMEISGFGAEQSNFMFRCTKAVAMRIPCSHQKLHRSEERNSQKPCFLTELYCVGGDQISCTYGL